MKTRIKICGITNEVDARICVDAGADALGFVFHPESPRCMSPQHVKAIADGVPPFVTLVGVFVDAPIGAVNEIVGTCGLHVVQLHGNETPEDCDAVLAPVIKAFRVRDGVDLPFETYRDHVTAFLLDAYVKGRPGGTGESFNWMRARDAKRFGRIILAGGITPENIAEAITVARPDAIDVSSGVESAPGRKDALKVRALFQGAAAIVPV